MKRRTNAPWGSKRPSSSPPFGTGRSSKKTPPIRPRAGERGCYLGRHGEASCGQPWGMENEGEERELRPLYRHMERG